MHQHHICIIFVGHQTAHPISVRLFAGQDSSSGIVQVWHEESWQPLCGDEWNLNIANVVCKQLGFNGATASEVNYNSSKVNARRFVWTDGLTCYGLYLVNLGECNALSQTWGFRTCSREKPASVKCGSKSLSAKSLRKKKERKKE